jgi:hypothetical protein
MDNSFLSAQNIDNIYEYINAEMVKSHNVNLNIDNKNKKIVKKLTKTVFDKIQKDFMNNGTNKAVSVNGFNDMVIKKCVPFLLNKTVVKNTSNKVEKRKPKKYSVKKNTGIKNFDLDIGETNGYPKHQGESGFQEYINNADDFEQLVKESNRQINDSFKAYSEKKSVFNSHDSITDSCSSSILHNDSDFVIDRCATKDDVDTKKLNSTAFNDVLEQKLTGSNSQNNASNPYANLPAYDSYNQINVKDILTNVLINQKDHSNNEVETYEGEMYLPNLISEVGEEAPIQPLMYQNTKQGTERFASKSIIIDTGDNNSKLNLTTTTSTTTPAPVTRKGTRNWSTFRINLQETFKIEKLCDVYVRNFTLIGATTVRDALYFVVKIDEINTLKPSNNRFIKDRVIFRNTNIGLDLPAGVSQNLQVVSHTFPFRSYYVASVNPQTFFSLNLELTNENGLSADDGGNNTFNDASANTNRMVIELEFIPREKPNEIIFDRTPYGSALNAELSNT